MLITETTRYAFIQADKGRMTFLEKYQNSQNMDIKFYNKKIIYVLNPDISLAVLEYLYIN